MQFELMAKDKEIALLRDEIGKKGEESCDLSVAFNVLPPDDTEELERLQRENSGLSVLLGEQQRLVSMEQESAAKEKTDVPLEFVYPNT